ncbi:23S rRNA (guanosine2251-2'-O)-methyltransferase [Mumia flava]|uniref:23S rRNA (Guanosine2251-2'-O)-methyltransferase n=1 Tax=Mumia flava TaxID=1348852 RepID=A0A0B2BPL7_9ACTN|nr:23S rRNA (guanosine(2251)-2'-O)-methyltransferase RlmB [Mumia flava]PJJ57102.1 23S rRNA (guanosine2251-2'-O)-methyltransferase [Mumia flava]
MAGNSQRKGAMNKSRKGANVGSGGQRRRGLEGKGPTPKAAERPNHKAYKMAKAAEKRRPPAPRKKRGDEAEWAAGRNSVLEVLRADIPIASLYVAEGIDRDDRVREIFALAVDKRLSVLEVSKPELDRFTDRAVHQGVAAKLPPYEYAHPDDFLETARERGEDPLIVVLDSITDPRNLGAIVRSASGFGAHGVVVPERRAAGMTASAWKTSAGAAARVPVARATNLTRQLKAYAAEGLMIAGLAADGEVALPDLDLAEGPLVLVVGSEGKGLSRLVSETCDVRVSIPMASNLESLNAGVAAGIALYAIDQRRSSGG